MKQFSFLTIDLEDWFHLLDLDQVMNVNDWDNYDSRIEKVTIWLLEVLAVHKVKAIFFILGWIADRYPDLIREIKRRGHTIGSHSHEHPLLYQLTEDEFQRDLVQSLTSIEKASGEAPKYYRAPGFSITDKNLWCMKKLCENGIEADFSIFLALAPMVVCLWHDVPHRVKFDSDLSLMNFP